MTAPSDWRENALCQKINLDLLYPPLDAEVPEHYYAIGREICYRCPVWQECLEEGRKEVWGMWGGLTPNERSVFSTSRVKVNALKPHGTWMRFRQGCVCIPCMMADETPPTPINMRVVPKQDEPIEDLSSLRFAMLFSSE